MKIILNIFVIICLYLNNYIFKLIDLEINFFLKNIIFYFVGIRFVFVLWFF